MSRNAFPEIARAEAARDERLDNWREELKRWRREYAAKKATSGYLNREPRTLDEAERDRERRGGSE